MHGDKRDTSNSAAQHKGAKMANTVATPPSVGGPAGMGLHNREKMVTVGVVKVWADDSFNAGSRRGREGKGDHFISSQRRRKK